MLGSNLFTNSYKGAIFCRILVCRGLQHIDTISCELILTAEVDALLLACDDALLLLFDARLFSRFCCSEVEPPAALVERLGSLRGILYL